MISRYKDTPPSDYWQEVEAYDEKLFTIAKHVGSFVVFGRTVDQYHASWLPEPSKQEPHDLTSVYWRGTQFGDKDGGRVYSHMLLGHRAIGIPGERTQMYDIYQYRARPLFKLLNVSHKVFTENTDSAAPFVDFESPPKLIRRAEPIPAEH